MKTHIPFQIVIFILVISGCQPKQTEPLPEHGLLWRITGNGLNSTSYLFGTYHLPGGMQVLDSIKGFDSIFNSTNQLISESQLGDFASNLKQKESKDTNLLKPWPVPDSTYNNLLTSQQKILLDSVINSSDFLRKIQQSDLSIRPIVLLDFIKFSSEVKPNKITTTGPILDLYLQGLAKKSQMVIVSLDSGTEYQEFKNKLSNHFSQLSYKNEVEILMYFIENQHDIEALRKDYFNTLETAYLEQNIEFIEKNPEEINVHNNIILSYFGSDEFLKFQKELLIDERNNMWMNRITNLIENKSSFIAVGAAHLGGKKGLINQLRKLNYTVVPIN